MYNRQVACAALAPVALRMVERGGYGFHRGVYRASSKRQQHRRLRGGGITRITGWAPVPHYFPALLGLCPQHSASGEGGRLLL